ncbi:MAG TPA: RnfH family protein [Dokdonella sp.]|uniref:RnfH family protein n=1 Tax=Dokdonella sp. TaxID=2291710 RepID=UPI002D7EB115|nr:RnfH family protein [Dokdonella sp.]HET9032727.1 RnfH family protein [Dokdonella sp.]
MSKPERVRVEVAYAELQRQFLRALEMPAGATVADALTASGVEHECAIKLDELRTGIWSKPVDRSRVVGDGDRIELYRPLKINPMEARRKRAKQKRPGS